MTYPRSHRLRFATICAALVVTVVGAFAVEPAISLARAVGISAGAPSESLRTAARLDPPADPPPPPPTAVHSYQERRLVELVNVERAKLGLAPLAVLAHLDQAAEAHALDQRNRSCTSLTHTGTDGSTMGNRVDRTGLQWSRLAENIACGYVDAETVMAAWIASTDHRRNILDGRLTHIGVSLELSDDGATYWVQVFATPRS